MNIDSKRKNKSYAATSGKSRTCIHMVISVASRCSCSLIKSCSRQYHYISFTFEAT